MDVRVRRSRDQWAKLAAQFEAVQGISKTAFRAERDVPLSSFTYWYRELRTTQPPMVEAVKGSPFVEVERLKPTSRGWESGSTCETIMECGRFRLRLDSLSASPTPASTVPVCVPTSSLPNAPTAFPSSASPKGLGQSLVSTCIACAVNHQYLTDVIMRVADNPQNAIDELLPHVWRPSGG